MILSYIRLNIKTLLLFLLFTAVFGAMAYVYGIPAEAIGYALLLCIIAALVTSGAAAVCRGCKLQYKQYAGTIKPY